MKRILYLFIFLTLSLSFQAQSRFVQKRFAGNGTKIEVNPDTGLGLEKIYLYNSLLGASVSYTTGKNNSVAIYSYQHSSSDKVTAPFSKSDPNANDEVTYTITNLEDSRGLIVEDGGITKAVWIIDYSQHRPNLNSIHAVAEADVCSMLKLMVDKTDYLEYRGLGIQGEQVRELHRKYSISYDVLNWDDKQNDFIKAKHTIKDLTIGTEFIIDKEVDKLPNINTHFVLTDQYGVALGMVKPEIESQLYEAVSVEAHMVAEQVRRNNDNEEESKDPLGGSAPVEIKFYGHGSGDEPEANYYTWFIYNTVDLTNPIARYTDKDIDYTFNQDGRYQVTLEVADPSSTCVDTVSVQFDIWVSELKIPNFFSPGSSPGSNDEFKVYYKSLIKYKCTIFNRWGNKVWESRDPAQGWDGRYKGSLVNPGVYYYSIEATGSDGRRYKEGGDINILH